VRLFHNLHKTRGNDLHLPAAYLMVARIFHEYLNDDAKAKALVEFLLKKYPQAVQKPQLVQLLDSINRTAVATLDLPREPLKQFPGHPSTLSQLSCRNFFALSSCWLRWYY